MGVLGITCLYRLQGFIATVLNFCGDVGKVWSLSLIEATRNLTRRKWWPACNNQCFFSDLASGRFDLPKSMEKGVSKANRGYKRGYKITFKKAEPSIHAGSQPSFNRPQPTIRPDKGR